MKTNVFDPMFWWFHRIVGIVQTTTQSSTETNLRLELRTAQARCVWCAMPNQTYSRAHWALWRMSKASPELSSRLPRHGTWSGLGDLVLKFMSPLHNPNQLHVSPATILLVVLLFSAKNGILFLFLAQGRRGKFLLGRHACRTKLPPKNF